MRFRTIVLALALACGLTGMGEAKKTVSHHPYKATKVKKFKAGKFKGHKQVVKRHAVKH